MRAGMRRLMMPALVCAGWGLVACTPQPLAERESAIVELQRSAYVVQDGPLGPVVLPAACLRAPAEAEVGATPSTPLGCASVMALDAGLYRPEDRLAPRRPGAARARTVTSPVYSYLGPEPRIGGFSAGSRRQTGRVENTPQEEGESAVEGGALRGNTE